MAATKTDHRKAILYARFSPRPNADECESCEHQLAMCREWCEKNGYAIVAEHRDDRLSGADEIEDRPGLWAALADVKAGYTLVASKYDRLARDVYLSISIERQIANAKGSLHSVVEGAQHSDPQSVLLRQILQAFAEYERKIIAARTSAAMKRHQQNGRRMTAVDRVPWGWSCAAGQKALRPNDHERAALARMKELRADGSSLSRIALTLENEGFKPRGKCWHTKSIARLLEQAV